MDGRIGHLHCEFRVPDGLETAGPAITRLENLARDRLAEAWETALADAFEDDPAVYVFRRIEAGLLLRVDENVTDTSLARQWGERLAGAVVRGVAGWTDEGEGRNLVTFASQAEFVANFVVDLLRERAFSRWYYGAFASLQPLGKTGALRTVLLDNADHLSEILRALQERQVLDQVLASLDAATLQMIWARLGSRTGDQTDVLRPLFAAAIGIIDRLDIWRHRPGEEVLSDWIARGQINIDWRDAQSLARAVGEIIAFLIARGDIQPLDTQVLAQIESTLNDVMLDFDWLDTGWLREAVPRLLVESSVILTDLPARPAHAGPTPKQRELLADIVSVLRDDRFVLDITDPESTANRLRLYVALVARSPRWQGDAAAISTIDHLIAAWSAIVRASNPSNVTTRLRRSDLDGALALLPVDQRPGARRPLALVAEIGDAALGAVDLLMAGDTDRQALASDWTYTECAGLFLLLRAIVDARLAGLIDRLGDEPVGPDRFRMLLIALGLRWTGRETNDEVVDEGLYLLAGLASPLAVGDVARRWGTTLPSSYGSVQEQLLALLAGQWLVRGSTLHVHHVEIGGVAALMGGGEPAGLWPLGHVLGPDVDPGFVLAGWSNAWQHATGERPLIIVTDRLLARLQPLSHDITIVGVPDVAGDDGEPLALEHARSDRALVAALESLRHGTLGIPDADLWIAVLSLAVLRVWARWLGPFATSSTPYLLEQFIRRSGRFRADANSIVVELEPRPLDVVLEMAGYLAEIEQISWLDNRRVELRIGDG